jgi:hypothetical protein
MTPQQQKDLAEIIKNYAQVAAWTVAGLYFLLRSLNGDFVVDASLTATTQRSASHSPGVDYLSVVVDLKRGSRGSLRLHDAVVIVTQRGTSQKAKLGIERFSFRQGGKCLAVAIGDQAEHVPTLNLAAGESAQFSTWFEVTNADPCVVEVVVVGTMFASLKVGQWRTSVVSLPNAKAAAGDV